MATHELQSWRKEKDAAWLYRILSDQESGNPRQLLFLELAKEADEQAELWANEIRKFRKMPPVGYTPGIRVKLVGWLIRRLSPQRIKPVLVAMKMRGLSVYSGRRIAGHPMPPSVEESGARHRGDARSNGMRTAVFGVNDGLVSITLLVVGVAGATEETTTILLTGVAGLLAGAFSMAAGEWFSLRSQREMFEYRIRLEHDEPAQYPTQETQELALIYQARGMSPEEAYTLAKRMIDNLELDLDTLARDEPGLNPDMPGSPWQTTMLSFFAFIFGGLIPLLPFLLEVRRHPLLIAGSVSCVAMFAVGATLSLIAGRQALWGGLRMLLTGVVAGAISYSLGSVLGTKVS